jgi:hypothetical protein
MKKHSNKMAGVAGLVCLLAAGTALAASYSNPVTVQIVEIADLATTCNGSAGCVGNGSQTIVTLTSAPTGASPARPTCGNGAPNSVVLYSPTGQIDHIKAMTNVVSSAFLAGKSVRVFYDTTCTDGVARVKAVLMQ